MAALVVYSSDSEAEDIFTESESGTLTKNINEKARTESSKEVIIDQGSAEHDAQVQLVEPRAPRRHSDLYEDYETEEEVRNRDTEDEDEEVEDFLLQKGVVDSAKYSSDDARGSYLGAGPAYTPRSTSSMDDLEELKIEQALPNEIPPSPPGECDPELKRKFISFFERKERGMDMNAAIKKRKDFKNPSLYEYLVKTYGIDEKGTNFPRSVYDPNSFRPEDFYDALGDYQASQEARRKMMEKKRPTSFPSAATSKNEADQKLARRSRFDGK